MQRIHAYEDIEHFDATTDVVVAGFGGAGGCAALEAKRAGSEVMLFESASGPGGSTALSACEMYLGGSGGTRLQKELGIEDSSENFLRYLEACFGPYADPARMRVFVDGAAEHFDWVEALGVRYRRSLFSGRDVVALTGDSLQYTGNERAYPFNEKATPVPRGHLPTDAGHDGGKVVMAALVAQVEAAGVAIEYDARIVGLIQDRAGRVRGAVVRNAGRDRTVYARQGVVLCMGGFIMNEAMTRKYIPQLDAIATRHGNPGDRGDGILLGMAAGGNPINMGEAFVGIAHYPPAQLTYGIFVNAQGQRFVNEDVYLARLGHFALQQSEQRIYMFIDNRYFARPDYLNTEIIAVGETVAEVETEAGFPEGTLQETVAFYNRHAALGDDPLFHKSAAWLAPLVSAPFALVSYSLADIRPPVFTLGGLEVLPTGEVLSPEGDIVPGLFAAGRTAAGIPRTSQGYASGMSVADATFFGRLAGRRAAGGNRLTL